jgi:N-dimethylarginine dimethylaminohydrolase
MNQESQSKVNIFVPSETGALKTVLMRLASPIDPIGSISALFERGVMYQMFSNSFASYQVERVQAQQLKLKSTLEAHGARVILEPPLKNSSGQYTRDIGFAIDDTFFVSRMGIRYRDSEILATEPWFVRFSKVVRLDAGRIEGGDVMLAPGRVLVGLGEATSEEGIASLKTALARIGNTREVVPLRFKSRGIIHLDTKFNLVAPNIAVISRHSFEEKSLKWLERNFQLIDATPEETRAVHINTFVIGDGHVAMDTRAERLASLLESNGLTPVLIDYSEVTRVPGSFRCSTLPLERSPD